MAQKIIFERKPGQFPEMRVSPGFFEPMSAEELACWEGQDDNTDASDVRSKED